MLGYQPGSSLFWGMLDQLSPGLMTDPTGDSFPSDVSHLAEKALGVNPAVSSKVNQSSWKRLFSSDSNRKNEMFGEIK